MTAVNFIQPSLTGGGNLPNVQPTTPGLWLNGGALTFYNGAINVTLDTVAPSDPNQTVDESISDLPALP